MLFPSIEIFMFGLKWKNVTRYGVTTWHLTVSFLFLFEFLFVYFLNLSGAEEVKVTFQT